MPEQQKPITPTSIASCIGCVCDEAQALLAIILGALCFIEPKQTPLLMLGLVLNGCFFIYRYTRHG